MRALLNLTVSALLLACVSSTAAQTPAPGRLLVATHELDGTTFAESVVLLLEYDDRGATGLLINRPTWVEAAAAFPDLDQLPDPSSPLFFGGPFAQGTLSALVHGDPGAVSGTRRVLADVFFADLPALGELTADGVRELRLYAGASSWAPGELEQEIDQGAWHVVTARSELVFAAEPRQLWEQMTARPLGAH